MKVRGSFANGAVTAAMAYAFSRLGSTNQRDKAGGDYDDGVHTNTHLIQNATSYVEDGVLVLDLGVFDVSVADGVDPGFAQEYIDRAMRTWNTTVEGSGGVRLETRLSLRLTDGSGHVQLRPCNPAACRLAPGAADRGGSHDLG